MGVKARRFFPESATFYYLTSALVSGTGHLGDQIIRNPARMHSCDVALCGVVEYRLDNEDIVLIPSCGNVSWD